MTIGHRLKTLRTALKMSQGEVGAACGVSQTLVYKWEQNITKPRVEHVDALSKLFKVPGAYILGIDEHSRPLPAPLPASFAGDETSTAGLRSLRVRGNSMDPTLSNGDLAVYREGDIVEDGAVAVISMAGDSPMIKRVFYDADGSLILSPDNENFGALQIQPEDIDALPVRFLGTVIEVRKAVGKKIPPSAEA